MQIESNSDPIVKKDLEEYFHSGSKEKTNWVIGTENEKFLYHKSNFSPVSFAGNNSIQSVLSLFINNYGWKPIKEGGYIIGLNDKEGKRSISLEPGCQIELSGAKLQNLHETYSELILYHEQLNEICDSLDLGSLALGFVPEWKLEQIDKVPKTRYKIMREYMPNVGSTGLDMMHRTATSQVNLDYSSENDMVKKFKVGIALQPIIALLFFNSPFESGRPSAFLSQRIKTWEDTDSARCGYLPFVFKNEFNFNAYTNYALEVPMYFIIRDGDYLVPDMDFKNFMANGYYDERHGKIYPTIKDWEVHLSTLFPQVRLKTFIEMRGADGGGIDSIMALSSIWTGLLYDQSSLDACYDIISRWTYDDIIQLASDLNHSSYEVSFKGKQVQEYIMEILDISREGLIKRSYKDDLSNSEDIYLSTLYNLTHEKIVPASQLKRQYETVWSQDIKQVYNKDCI